MAANTTGNSGKKPSNKGLGRGLSALLADEEVGTAPADSVVHLPINSVSPNADQPRKHFDTSRLEELSQSIHENGVIQPIIVTHGPTGYRIVAGERRWRASRLAGLTEIPAIIRELTETQVLEQALIENIQRQDLNPIEEAQALEKLLNEHNLTQERIATMLGRSRPAIANTIRLLHLSGELQTLVVEETLSAGHARALLALPDEESRKIAAAIIQKKDLNVRQTEAYVRKILNPRKTQEPQPADPEVELTVRDLESRLQEQLGTKVRIQNKNNKGKIVIDYYSYDDLDRILEFIDHSGRAETGENVN